MFASTGGGAPDIDAMMRQSQAMQQQQASGLPVPGMNGRKEATLPDGTKVVLEMNKLTLMGPQGGTSVSARGCSGDDGTATVRRRREGGACGNICIDPEALISYSGSHRQDG